MAAQADQLVAIINDICKDISFGTATTASEADRLRIRAAARKLLFHVEKPQERPWGFSFDHMPVFASIQICADLGIWGAWQTEGGGSKTIDELVQLSWSPQVAPNLLRRLFRMMAAFHVVDETAADTFQPTPFAQALGYDFHGASDTRRHVVSDTVATSLYTACGHNLPKYLAEIGYQDPTADPRGSSNANHTAVDPDGLSYFARMQVSPELYQPFQQYMQSWTASKTPWTKIYDPKLLLEGLDWAKAKATPLIVDVGGNVGQDLAFAVDALKNLPDGRLLPEGSLVLQDIPEAIRLAESESNLADSSIKTMAHDFFQAQPVKGARMYLLHAVLHDWPDAEALTILRRTREAMTPGYSKLLVVDVVMPYMEASIVQTVGDINMMSLLSSAERTKSAWEKLVTDGSFRVTKFWPDPNKYENVIELEVREE